MDVKVGTFFDEKGVELHKKLNSIGIKSEIKRSLSVSWEESFIIEGKLSYIKKKYSGTEFEGEIDKWENYLDISRKILNEKGDGLTGDEFSKEFLSELIPDMRKMDTKRLIEKLVFEKAEEVDIESRPDEDKLLLASDIFRTAREEIKKDISKQTPFIEPIHCILGILSVKDLKETIIKTLPDDPFLKLSLSDIDVKRAEELGLRSELEVFVENSFDIYADICQISERMGELMCLCNEYEDVFSIIIVFGLIEKILRAVKKQGVNREDLIRNFEVIEKGNMRLNVNFESMYWILKTLSRTGVLKINFSSLTSQPNCNLRI